MAITFVRVHGNTMTKDAGGTTISVTTTAAVPVGNTLVAWIASDNTGSSTPTISSYQNWNVTTPTMFGHGAAVSTSGASTRGFIVLGTVETQIASGTAVGVTLSANVACRGIILAEFSGVDLRTTRTGSGAASAANASILSGDLVLGLYDAENNGALTGDSDTTNGSWSTAAAANTSGGGAAANLAMIGQYKITTAAGTQTYSGTGGSDGYHLLVAAPALPPAPSAPTSAPTATAISEQIAVTTPATLEGNAESYSIYRDGTLIASDRGAGTTYNDSGASVIAGQTYTVRGVNVSGTSTDSPASSSVAANPMYPTNVGIRSMHEGARVQFTARAYAAKYRIYRGPAGGSRTLVHTTATQSASVAVSWDDSGLTDGTQYDYKVATYVETPTTREVETASIHTLRAGYGPLVSGDDGYALIDNLAVFNSTAQTLSVGYTSSAPGPSSYRSFIRIPNVQVPQGATIDSATFYYQVSALSSTCSITWFAADSDNPAAPTTAGGVAGLTPTTANTSDVLTSTGDKSVNLTSVIQEIVDRSGFASGNAIMLFAEDGTAGISTITGSIIGYDGAASSTDSPVLVIAYTASSGTPVGQVSTTDAAQVVGKAKTKAVAQLSELDEPQVVTGRKAKAIGQPESIGTAQAITPTITRRYIALGQASSTDEAAQALTATITRRYVALGQVATTDTAQSVGRIKTKAIGQSSEVDSAGSVTVRKSRILGQVSEVDQTFALVQPKFIDLAQASEADGANPFGKVDPIHAGVTQPSETDTAGALTATITRRYISVGQVVTGISWSDEFDDGSIDSKWSWVNQQSATISETGGSAVLQRSTNGDYNLRVQTAPTGDFDLQAKATLSPTAGFFLNSGLVLYNSGNGRMLAWGSQIQDTGGQGARMARWNSVSSFNSFGIQVANAGYFRVALSGSTFTFYTSTDGSSWTSRGTETLANFLGAITHIGFGLGVGNSQTCSLSVDYFRLTPDGPSETAQTLGRTKSLATGQASQTELAQPISSQITKLIDLLQASQTDTAQALTAAKRLAIGQPAETDLAQPVAVRLNRYIALAQASETDSTLAPARLKSKAVQLTGTGIYGEEYGETYSGEKAQALTALRSRTLGQPSTTDSAQALTPTFSRRYIALGQVSETDQATTLSFAGQKFIGLAQVTELDDAQPMGLVDPIHRALTGVSETDSVTGLGHTKTKGLAQATQTETAQALARTKRKVLGQVSETDTAQPFTSSHRKSFGAALEADSTGALSSRKIYGLGQVSETATAQPVQAQRRIGLGQVSEVDTSQALTRSKWRTLGQPSELDAATALSFAGQKFISLAQVTETDSASAITPTITRRYRTVGQVGETDVSSTLTRVKKRTMVRINEVDTAAARTNLLYNPSFEIDTDGNGIGDFWGIRGSNTAAQSIVASPFGSGSAAQVVSDGNVSGNGNGITHNISTYRAVVSPDMRLTLSLDAKNVVGTPLRFGIEYFAESGGYISGTYSPAGGGLAAGASGRVSVTAIAPSLAVGVGVIIWIPGSTTAGWTFIADNVLLERSPTADGYFDGDSSGANWLGTPENSQSQIRALGITKSRTLGQTVETEAAQSITPVISRRYIPVGQVTETETAQPIGSSLRVYVPVGQVIQTSSVGSLASRKTKTLGAPSETDTAQPTQVLQDKLVAVGQVSDTETARSIGVLKKVYLGQLVETDTVTSLGVLKTLGIGRASEIDSTDAVSVHLRRYIDLGQVEETDEAGQWINIATRRNITWSVTRGRGHRLVAAPEGSLLVAQASSSDASVRLAQPRKMRTGASGHRLTVSLEE